MTINADHYFAIGKNHQICEDYALSGMDPIPYVILSDGCSSSRHTDVGARILVHIAEHMIKTYCWDSSKIPDYQQFGWEVIHRAQSVAKIAGLNISCLDATLIVVFLVDEYVNIYMYGDGNIIKVQKDGVGFINQSYNRNAPYYLTYWTDPARKESYEDMVGSKGLIRNIIDIDGKKYPPHEIGIDVPNSFEFHKDTVKLIAIASDGIESFVRKGQGEVVDFIEISKELIAFKNYNGEFIKRRTKRALKNFEKENMVHSDDISFGAIVLERE